MATNNYAWFVSWSVYDWTDVSLTPGTVNIPVSVVGLSWRYAFNNQLATLPLCCCLYFLISQKPKVRDVSLRPFQVFCEHVCSPKHAFVHSFQALLWASKCLASCFDYSFFCPNLYLHIRNLRCHSMC